MPDQYSVAEIIKVFKELYRTIDVRTALLKHDDRWWAICVIIRLTPDSRMAIEDRFQRLETRYGRLDAERIRVLQYCHPIGEFERIAAALKERRFLFGDIGIPLEKAIDLFSLRGRIEPQLPP
jgi:hypothetical protein